MIKCDFKRQSFKNGCTPNIAEKVNEWFSTHKAEKWRGKNRLNFKSDICTELWLGGLMGQKE